MKDYIEALKEIKKESKDFEITLSRKEVLEITKEFDRLNNIINELEREIKWQRKVSLSLNEAFAVSRIDTLINKLQELKGEYKE